MEDDELSDVIRNILICALKMKEGLADLERHEGEYLLTKFLFLGEQPFNVLDCAH